MSDWQGKRVVIIGAARQGLALARYLVARGARVVVTDHKPASELSPALDSLSDLPVGSVEWVLGGHPLEVLTGADLLCLSGGVSIHLPLVAEAQRRGIPLSNDSQIFLEAVPCPVIGITGSAGKTTTTTLVGRMANAAKTNGSGHKHDGYFHPNQVWVGGNIGNPLISVLDQMTPKDLAVVELSSFQLEIMTRSPQVAAVLNITPNHLDRHASMEEYTAAKRRILEFQERGGAVVLNREDPGSWGLRSKLKGSRLVTFGVNRPDAGLHGSYLEGSTLNFQDGKIRLPLMPRSEILLRGEHNLVNVLAACAICWAAELPPIAVRDGVAGFTGVPHRLEFVRSWGGASWYNDSIATAPERTMAAIRSFQEPLVLLAGGRDKNLPWEEFAALAAQRVDHLILFGEAAEKIAAALKAEKVQGQARPYTLAVCRRLEDAVQAAAATVEEGDVVLLSPGGTSFDEFRDFEDRGEAFRRWVMRLP